MTREIPATRSASRFPENREGDMPDTQPLTLALSCCYRLPLESEHPLPDPEGPESPEFHASFSLAPQHIAKNRDTPYAPPQTATRTSRNDVELRVRAGGFNAQGLVRQELADHRDPEYRAVANQFYYDGQISAGLGWTVGKKVMTWGVGFGFKPLDVIQREDRRAVNPPPLVGVSVLALESFTATDAWSLIWSRPGNTGARNDAQDTSLTMRWYRLADGDDLYGLVRLSQHRKLEFGAGITHVIGETWSIYGSALHQQRSWRRLNSLLDDDRLLAEADPLVDRNEGRGIKAQAGVQWTGENGVSVLAEAWYDDDAYSKQDWQRLGALTARQRAFAGLLPAQVTEGNVAWSSQAFLATNLLRENVLLRISYDNRDGFKPYGEILATPGDGGLVFTAGAQWERNRQKFEIGIRQVGGQSASAYSQAPISRIIWAGWCIALF